VSTASSFTNTVERLIVCNIWGEEACVHHEMFLKNKSQGVRPIDYLILSILNSEGELLIRILLQEFKEFLGRRVVEECLETVEIRDRRSIKGSIIVILNSGDL
jgi:hypothetical protein